MTERIGIMYGSTTANSERTAETIWDIMKETELHDIKDGVDVLEQYEKIILVSLLHKEMNIGKKVGQTKSLFL